MTTIHLTNTQLDQLANHRIAQGQASLEYSLGSLVAATIDKWHRVDAAQVEAVDSAGGPLGPLYKLRSTYNGHVFHAFAHQMTALD